MDFFDNKYYALNKKLLILMGQWPYQCPRVRLRIQFFFYVVMATILFVQNAKLITARHDLYLTFDIFINDTAVMICALKQITCSINDARIKDMLERMKANWTMLKCDDDEYKILHETAEAGRKFTLFYALYGSVVVSILSMALALTPFIDTIIPLNESRRRLFLFPAEYFVDEEKYYYPILFHMYITSMILLVPIVAADTMYASFAFHIHGLFKLTSYRLEHAFDKCSRESANSKVKTQMSEVLVNITAAVRCHCNATKFVDDISATYGSCFFLLLIPMLIDITGSLFCAALAFGNVTEMIKPLALYITLLLVLTTLLYPAQKVLDYSENIPFKAYSGQWYNAPNKEQALLLPILQRGLKPSGIVMGNMCVLSKEIYGWLVQTSLSYFTVLLSFKY